MPEAQERVIKGYKVISFQREADAQKLDVVALEPTATSVLKRNLTRLQGSPFGSLADAEDIYDKRRLATWLYWSMDAELLTVRDVAQEVAGANKQEALAASFYGERDPLRFPAQAISAGERLLWITDQEISGQRVKPSG